LEGLAKEDVGICCGHSVNFPAIWYILRAFGTFCGHLVYFSHFGMLYQEKSGNPAKDFIGRLNTRHVPAGTFCQLEMMF
jgi:hypothetical protein